MQLQFALVAALAAIVSAAPALSAANPLVDVEVRACTPVGGWCNDSAQCCSNNCRFGDLPNQSSCREPLGSPNGRV